ncbi:MAG TPA: oxidoreductase [Nocardioidaceae bacterium]|nr:oxidoreductase [Nocardioidaceae bacterium]
MRILVLGGTAWLGGEIARAALSAGHEVTCLARGESGSVPDGAQLVQADREQASAYDAVASQDWNLVADVSRQPGQVRSACAALTGRAARYGFVSTGNVYADHGTPGTDESAELLAPLDGDVMESLETYGEAKVACEQAVLGAFGPERTLIARAGLIGGPGDMSGRTGYWPWRFARPSTDDGSVLVPEIGAAPTQVIDVRDLASWIVQSAEAETSGVYNATGDIVPFDEHIATAREAAGHTGAIVTASPDWLAEHEVRPWMGERSLPLWLPMPDFAGFSTRDNTAARAAGLQSRPLKETLADTLAWELEEGAERERGAGLSDADERELLLALSPR